MLNLRVLLRLLANSIVQTVFPGGYDCDMKNPFPGMNPWLEDYWRDVHAKVLVYACDQLNGELPPGVQGRVDERLAIDAERKAAARSF